MFIIFEVFGNILNLRYIIGKSVESKKVCDSDKCFKFYFCSFKALEIIVKSDLVQQISRIME